MKGRYLIEATVIRCSANIKLNDVLLIKWPGHIGTTVNWFVNQWVVTGENTLEVEINEGPYGFDPQSRVRVELNYYEYDPEAIIGKSDHTTIASVEWAPPPPPDPPEKPTDAPELTLEEQLEAPKPSYDFPETLFGAGRILEPQPDWKWLKGDTIVPTPDAMLQLVGKINSLITAIREKDAKSFDSILGILFDEIDIAYDLSKGKTAKDMVIKKAWDIKDWDVKDISIENVDMKLYANGRLLEITDKNGGEIIQAIDDVAQFPVRMRLFFAKIDGEYVIAR